MPKGNLNALSGLLGAAHCRAVGRPLYAEIEPAVRPERVDHVWLMLDAGDPGGEPPSLSPAPVLKLAINTTSLRNRVAGFDPRIRVGIHRETYADLPAVGVFPHPGLDYAQYELEHNVFYEHFEHHAMEALLIDKIREAILVEVWGQLYTRSAVGIHQIHSRRASCAVPEDLIGKDGAIKFYYAEGSRCEMLLFKFCGQP